MYRLIAALALLSAPALATDWQAEMRALLSEYEQHEVYYLLGRQCTDAFMEQAYGSAPSRSHREAILEWGRTMADGETAIADTMRRVIDAARSHAEMIRRKFEAARIFELEDEVVDRFLRGFIENCRLEGIEERARAKQ